MVVHSPVGSLPHARRGPYAGPVTTPTAIDLFAGAGGATSGLKQAGLRVLAAVESDGPASATFRANHSDVKLWERDIRSIKASEMRRELQLERGELALLKACPPCQGFSSLAEGRAKPNSLQNDLVLDTIRFVRALGPRSVMFENVPGLGRDGRSVTLAKSLEGMGYVVRKYQVNAMDFGVPQRRKRLIILALKGKRKELPLMLPVESSEAPVPASSAFDAVAKSLASGMEDSLNVYRKLSEAVQARVSHVPEGGSRFDLPEEHQLDCHRRMKTRSATSSYGRMRLDEPAPTMTTRCTTVACGSFIHPKEDRGISLREAATIQTFPVSYRFVGNYGQIERQIGNAVPVRMAARLGELVTQLL